MTWMQPLPFNEAGAIEPRKPEGNLGESVLPVLILQ